MPLSELSVRKAKPRERAYKLRDGDGLYLLVKENGSKLWRVNYRYLGKYKTLALGAYPELGLAGARDKRFEARKLLSAGIDPSEHKQEQRKAAELAAANTFEAVAKEYLTSIQKPGLAAITVEKKRWILEDLVNPLIGKRSIGEIRTSEVLNVLKGIEETGRLETAKRTRQVIGSVFQLACLTDRATHNPANVLQRTIKAPRVTSHPAIVREEAFGALLRDIETFASPIVRHALNFLAYTFPRPIELRFMDWHEVDERNWIWTIPAKHAKMRRPHDVPLVAQARATLACVARVTGRRRGLVFPSPLDATKPISENTLNKALAVLGYKGRHTSHGFRSSASTILNERRYREAVIEVQLNHLDPDQTRRAYNRARYWDERVALMEEWAGIVDSLRQSQDDRSFR
jgi:integrase